MSTIDAPGASVAGLVLTTPGSHVITTFAAVGSFGMALVAICLSAVSLGIHYLTRDTHPDVAAITARCDQMQLAQADMIDRIEHWTRRDRVRRLRDGLDAKDEAAAPPHVNAKQALRVQAKQSGILR